MDTFLNAGHPPLLAGVECRQSLSLCKIIRICTTKDNYKLLFGCVCIREKLKNILLYTKMSCDIKCYEIFACKLKPKSRNRRIM